MKSVDAARAWDVALSQLELQLNRASFDTWLGKTTFLRHTDDTFVIGAHSPYARDMLQHRLYRTLRRVLSEVVGTEVELCFEVYKPERPKSNPDAENEMPLFKLLAQQAQEELDTAPLHEQIVRPERATLPESTLNAKLTFERFVVNKSNRMAYEAARSVAEYPASVYNPLLIYGGVGIGKTHMLQAIAHVYQTKGLRTLYLPSEAFVNDLVDSIRNRTTAMFREKYRTADVLLVDDIQFIRNKESTQEEFFHTFNTLTTYNKQVVLASDRHPRELETLEARLRSRFEGGLVVDIQPPEFETRVAIVEMWANERNIELDRSIVEMIAEHAHNHVRELEGVFNQILAKTHLAGGSISLHKAEKTLNNFERKREYITLAMVVNATAEAHGVNPHDLMGKRRTSRITQARQVGMYLARELTDASLPQIGEAFGGRTHSTVLHSCNKVADDIEVDDILRMRIEKIKHRLRRADA